MVTIILLLAHHVIAERAVLVDVGPEVGEEGARRIREFVRGTAEFASLEDFIARVAASDPFCTREHIARTARYNLMRRADGKYASKHDLRRRLAEVGAMQTPRRPSLTCPVLIARGGERRVLTAGTAERFGAELADARLVTVPACGHNVHSQNSPGSLAAALPFIDGS